MTYAPIVLALLLGCFSYRTGVALGQVPRDARADAHCSVFDRDGEGAAGAAP